ncbi:MAG: hypothetical protein HeimC2_18020 [Candidatus Heimdallarchaeota archaeon LC_2]|nr:MAG: hypothetical protein HeimC2_18020 [Candidatus Heimdallarchaeota archaeon LC_2]
MKIGFVGSMGLPPKYGGFETCVDHITELLSPKHELYVFSVDPDGAKYKNNIFTPKIAFQTKIPAIDRILRELLPLLFCIIHKIRIIHVHGPLLTAPLWKLLRFKIIMSTDGIEWERLSYSRLTRIGTKLGYRIGTLFSDFVTYDSKVAYKEYVRIFGRNGPIVPYGPMRSCNIGHNHILPANLKNNEYLLFVGRIVPEKGVYQLVSAFNKIENRGLKLVILGNDVFDGSFINKLKSIASKSVIFLPARFDCSYETITKGAFAVVKPSIQESEGLNPSLIEAMVWNGSIIASEVAQNIEGLGKFGYKFDPNNEDNLVKILQYCIDNPIEIGKKKSETQNWAKNNYRWDKSVLIIEDLYRQLF